MLISILLPILFYIMLHAEKMGPLAKVGYGLLIALSLAFTVLMAWMDWLEFLKMLNQEG